MNLRSRSLCLHLPALVSADRATGSAAHRCRLLFSLLTACASLPLTAPPAAAQVGPDSSLGKPSPQDIIVEAVRGESIEITLTNESKSPSSRIDFVIKDVPLYGELLSQPRINTRRPTEAVVTYRSNANSKSNADTFTWYSRYHPNGFYAAPARVTIKLTDPAPVLEFSDQVYFGSTVVGRESVREMRAANVGNAPFDKILELPPPWRFIDLPNGRLTLKPGEERIVKIGYLPTTPGSMVYELRLQEGKGGSTLLNGEAYLPFRVEPSAVELEYAPATRIRSATVSLYGLSSNDIIVAVLSDGRLASNAGDRMVVKSGNKHEFQLSLPASDAKAYQGFVTLATEGFSTQLKVVAPATPPFVAVEMPDQSSTINFGEVVPGLSLGRAFRLHNHGGKDAIVDVQLPPPFELIAPDTSNFIPPQSSRDYTVLFTSQEGSPSALHRQELTIRSGAQVIGFDVSVLVSAPMKAGSLSTMDENRLPPLAGDGTTRNLLPHLRDPVTGRTITPPKPIIPVLSEEEMDEKRTPLGFITEDLNVREYSPRVQPVPMFELLQQRRTNLVLGWELPSPNQRQFIVDMRMTRQNTQTFEIDSVWVPWPDVEFEIAEFDAEKGETVRATVLGLDPNTIYEMRIVSVSANGLYAKPSEPLGIRTAMPIDWTWFERIVILSGVALLGWFGWRIRVWRRENSG